MNSTTKIKSLGLDIGYSWKSGSPGKFYLKVETWWWTGEPKCAGGIKKKLVCEEALTWNWCPPQYPDIYKEHHKHIIATSLLHHILHNDSIYMREQYTTPTESIFRSTKNFFVLMIEVNLNKLRDDLIIRLHRLQF